VAAAELLSYTVSSVTAAAIAHSSALLCSQPPCIHSFTGSDCLVSARRSTATFVGHVFATPSVHSAHGVNLASHIYLAHAACLPQVRSTAAVTRASAGVADNVLPQSGSVTINFRLLPGDTPETALQLTRTWLGRWECMVCHMQQLDHSCSCSFIHSIAQHSCSFTHSTRHWWLFLVTHVRMPSARASSSVRGMHMHIGNATLWTPRHLLQDVSCAAARCRDAAAANVSLKSGVPWQPMVVTDAAGPHFAIMREAIQAAWRLGGRPSRAVPVLPVLLPGGKQHVM
jgi:hypothetical protein